MIAVFNFNGSSAVAGDGNEIFRSDARQFAGLLFGLSICATFFPMANLAGLVGPGGTTVDEGIALSTLIASVFVIAIGLTGMLIGYLSLIHDFGDRRLKGYSLVLVQTAWIPYITDMTNVGKLAATGSAFIPAIYNPTAADVRAVGAFGMLGIFSFGACFLGALAFMMFSLYAFQTGQPGNRTASYFRGRLRVYSFLVFVAGLAQLLFGVLVLSEYGSGPLVPAPGVAMFTVTFPEISIFVGVVYISNGVYGFCRAFSTPSQNDNSFLFGLTVQYFCTVVFMIVTQIAHLPGGTLAGAAPSRACLTLGAHVLPAFLDFKARSTPEEIPNSYYGLPTSGTSEGYTKGETKDSSNIFGSARAELVAELIRNNDTFFTLLKLLKSILKMCHIASVRVSSSFKDRNGDLSAECSLPVPFDEN